MILVDFLFKDPDPGGWKVPDPLDLDPQHCFTVDSAELPDTLYLGLKKNVGCTAYSGECVSVGFGRVLLPNAYKNKSLPKHTHLNK